MKNRSKKQHRRRITRRPQQQVGIAWYRREQWVKLLEVSVDRGDLEDSYDEWLVLAEKAMFDLTREGLSLRKVDVDVDELLAWCESQNTAVDGAARARFVAEALAEKRPRR